MKREDYEDKEGGDPLNRVMISTHHIKTKLIQHRKKTRSCVKVDTGDPTVATIFIVAVGGEESLMHPADFKYHDPFNSWHCSTTFFNSSKLKNDIENGWKDLETGAQVEQAAGTSENEHGVWKSVAKHQVWDACKQPKMLKLVRGSMLKPANQDKMLEFTAHCRDKRALQNSLEQKTEFLEQCLKWHQRGQCISLLEEIKSTFFCESNLPCSFKFATSRLKHQILPRPNQLGFRNKLALLYHDDAHIPFSHEEAVMEVIKEEDVVAHLETTVEKLEIQ